MGRPASFITEMNLLNGRGFLYAGYAVSHPKHDQRADNSGDDGRQAGFWMPGKT